MKADRARKRNEQRISNDRSRQRQEGSNAHLLRGKNHRYRVEHNMPMYSLSIAIFWISESILGLRTSCRRFEWSEIDQEVEDTTWQAIPDTRRLVQTYNMSKVVNHRIWKPVQQAFAPSQPCCRLLNIRYSRRASTWFLFHSQIILYKHSREILDKKIVTTYSL